MRARPYSSAMNASSCAWTSSARRTRTRWSSRGTVCPARRDLLGSRLLRDRPGPRQARASVAVHNHYKRLNHAAKNNDSKTNESAAPTATPVKRSERQPRCSPCPRGLRPPGDGHGRRLRRPPAQGPRSHRSVRLRQGLGDRGGRVAARRGRRARTTGSTPAATSWPAAGRQPAVRGGSASDTRTRLIAWPQSWSDRQGCRDLGDYERGDHVRDPRAGAPPGACAASMVVGPRLAFTDEDGRRVADGHRW